MRVEIKEYLCLCLHFYGQGRSGKESDNRNRDRQIRIVLDIQHQFKRMTFEKNILKLPISLQFALNNRVLEILFEKANFNHALKIILHCF